MPDGSHRKEKLNVRVTPSVKEEWKASLGEGETLTSLVQTAVERHLNDEYVHVGTIENLDSGGSDVDLSEVTERLDDLHGTIESLHQEMDALASTGSSYDTDQVSEVAMDLMDHIPTWATPDLPEQRLITGEREKLDAAETAIKDDLRNERDLTIDGSVDRLANEVDESPGLVRQALIYLEQNTTANIGSVVVDGTRHWVQL